MRCVRRPPAQAPPRAAVPVHLMRAHARTCSMPLPAPFPPGTALHDLVTLLGSRPQAEMHKETMQKAMAAQRKAVRQREVAKREAEGVRATIESREMAVKIQSAHRSRARALPAHPAPWPCAAREASAPRPDRRC